MDYISTTAYLCESFWCSKVASDAWDEVWQSTVVQGVTVNQPLPVGSGGISGYIYYTHTLENAKM